MRWILFSMLTFSISIALGQTATVETESNQWYQKWLNTGNFNISHFCGVSHTDTIGNKESFAATLRTSKELYFYIPENYQQIDSYGNQYIQAYLYNFTDSAVTLQRFDDALGFVEHYFKPDTTWIQTVPPQIGLCGNGIWTQQLLPNHYLRLRIESASLYKGDIAIPYKMKLKINDNVVIEAKPIMVKLIGSQLNTITQTIIPGNKLH